MSGLDYWSANYAAIEWGLMSTWYSRPLRIWERDQQVVTVDYNGHETVGKILRYVSRCFVEVEFPHVGGRHVAAVNREHILREASPLELLAGQL